MFYDNLKAICDNKGLKITPIVAECGGAKGSITNWRNGAIPNSDIVIRLAKRLGVTTDYLLLGSDKCTLSREQEELLSHFNNLSSVDKGKVIGKAETLAELAAEREAKERVAEQSKKATTIAVPTANEQLNLEDSEPEHQLIKIMHSFYKVSAGHGFDLSGDDEWEEIEIHDTPEARKADYALTIQGDSMEPIYYNGDIVLVKKQDAVDIGQVGIFVLDGFGFIKKYNGDRLISLNEKYDDILLKDYSDCRCDGRVIGRV